MFALAAALPGRVVITTTTRIFAAQMALAPAVCTADDLSQLADYLDEYGRCLIIGQVAGEKAKGVDPSLPGRLLARPDVDFVLVEADGSRMRPVKAPADHEPVIPPDTTLLVPVAGIDAFDRPLDDAAHRPEQVRRILDQRSGHGDSLLTPADHLTAAGLAAVLADPNGGLKNAPGPARIISFINQVETATRLAEARLVARHLLHMAPDLSRVVMGAARSSQPVREVRRRVAAVVLAAGESQRMGRNKLLLPWGSTTVLEQTIDNVRSSGITTIVVVTGHEAEAISRLPLLADLPLRHNADYAEGMLSSVQSAVRAAPDSWEALLVVLGDQPMVGPELMDQLLITYAQGTAGLVVPRYNGRRGNPALIDRRYFTELLALPKGSAPRALLERHPGDIAWVDVDSDAVVHDLDRPEDYARQRPRRPASQ
jgi:molybdenum cofactor cytidylyltransferase